MYFDDFGSFLAIFRPFLPKKKCAGVPEAFWGWIEVVASGHGVCTPSAHFFALKIAQNISNNAYFDCFWSFLAILRPFLSEKKVRRGS